MRIKEASKWKIPKFIHKIYWHTDYTTDCKWVGFKSNGEPCSNIKQWVKLHQNGVNIKKIISLGGGNLLKQTVKYLHKTLKIPIYKVTDTKSNKKTKRNTRKSKRNTRRNKRK